MANAPTLTLPNFCQLLVKSKLVPSEIVKEQYELWQSRNSGSEDLDSFRKFLVKAAYLSEYQSAMLARGHAEGFQLDSYTIQDRLGKGRMAGVFRATHPTGEVVAIKVLPPSSAKDPMLLSRFQREAKLLVKLDHPNVVQAYQFGESNGKHYLVMEYLEGETLDEMLHRRGKLPPQEAAMLVYQALLGLDHLFQKNMVHRDIKPANLILIPAVGASLAENSLKATVKLLDIGLGKSFFDEESGGLEAETQLTSEGVLLGTPDYLAPEQAKNAATADIRADIYSLGCMFYHCLTGKPPFPDTNLMNQIIRHATEPVRPLSDFIQPVPDRLQFIIDNMLTKDPARRYQTPEKAALDLKAFLKNPPELPAPPGPSQKYLNWLHMGTTVELPTPAAVSSKKESGTIPRPAENRKAEAPRAAAAAPQPAVAMPTAKVVEKEIVKAAPKPKPEMAKVIATPPAPKIEPLASMSDIPLEPEFDVELVAIDERDADRGLFDLQRRDFMMLGMGAIGALAAVGIGYFASKALKKEHAE